MKKVISIVTVLMLLFTMAVPVCGRSVVWPTFDSLGEYEEFVRTNDLPEDFVYASDFLVLGNFVWGSVRSLTERDDSSNYSYAFEDENYITLYVHVYHGGVYDHAAPEKLTASAFEESMRYARGVGERSVYVREGVRYVYLSDGRLDRIQWKQGSACFELEADWPIQGQYGYQVDAVLGDYPTGEDQVLMRQLLSCDDEVFRAAFQELTAELDGQLDAVWADNVPLKRFKDEASHHKNLTFTCVAIVLALGGMTTALLIRKKRQAE